jgi:hypothetical protein
VQNEEAKLASHSTGSRQYVIALFRLAAVGLVATTASRKLEIASVAVLRSVAACRKSLAILTDDGARHNRLGPFADAGAIKRQRGIGIVARSGLILISIGMAE